MLRAVATAEMPGAVAAGPDMAKEEKEEGRGGGGGKKRGEEGSRGGGEGLCALSRWWWSGHFVTDIRPPGRFEAAEIPRANPMASHAPTRAKAGTLSSTY